MYISFRLDRGDIVQNVFHRCQFVMEMQGDLFVTSRNDVRQQFGMFSDGLNESEHGQVDPAANVTRIHA